jgi:hypothetical protein
VWCTPVRDCIVFSWTKSLAGPPFWKAPNNDQSDHSHA